MMQPALLRALFQVSPGEVVALHFMDETLLRACHGTKFSAHWTGFAWAIGMSRSFAKREKVVIATFYRTPSGDEPVRAWLKGPTFDNEDRKVIGADIQVVEYEWPKVSERSLVKGFGAGLWEVRSTLPSRRIARLLFGVAEGRMMIVHGFIKKTQKTPAADLRLAIDRWRAWKKGSSA